MDAPSLVKAALQMEAPVDSCCLEFEALQRELQRRENVQVSSNTHPKNWAVAEQASFLLYTLVRLTKPSVVLETGVANGHSTFFMLNALAKNDRGTLHSIDVSPHVAPYLDSRERQQWSLILLDKQRRRSSFFEAMAAVPKIDMFVHDSDHRRAWQTLEYMTALEHLDVGGILASDDVDSSHAFLDLCRMQVLAPHFLFDGQRLFGLVTKR